MKNKKIKIGLALGGGGALGFAHIGVLEVLEENGIEVDLIAGISMGSIIGSAYASGKTTKEMKEMAYKFKTIHLFDINLKTGSLLSGYSAEKWIRNVLNIKDFNETKIPFACTACDLYSGKEIVFKSGDIVKAVRASISAPAIFRPVEMDNMCLVDGGLLGNVPAQVVKDMGADIVIAVDVLGEYKVSKKPNSITTMIFDCIFLQQNFITKTKITKKNTDVYINLNLGLNKQQVFSKKYAMKYIEKGREETLKIIPLLKDKIEKIKQKKKLK